MQDDEHQSVIGIRPVIYYGREDDPGSTRERLYLLRGDDKRRVENFFVATRAVEL